MAGDAPHTGTGADTSRRVALFSAAKFVPPPLPDHYGERPRLDARFDASARARVTVVSGPAGSGKSALVSAFLSRRPERCSWITLDAHDDDVRAIWAVLAHGFDRLFAGAR